MYCKFSMVYRVGQKKVPTFEFFFFFVHNLKIYNLTKKIYKNDTIGSMIGMATLNDLLTKNQYRY